MLPGKRKELKRRKKKGQDQVVEVSQVDLDRLCYALSNGVDECDEINDTGMNGILPDDFESELEGDEVDCSYGAFVATTEMFQDPDVCKSQTSSRAVSLGVEAQSCIEVDNTVDAERAKAFLSSNVIRSDRETEVVGETGTQWPDQPEDVDPSILETQRLNLAIGQEVFQCCSEAQSDAVCGWAKSEADREETKTYNMDVYGSVNDQEVDETPILSILTDQLVYNQHEEVGYQDRMYAEPYKHLHKRWRMQKDLCGNPNNIEKNNTNNDKYMSVDCCVKDTYDPAVDISTTYLWSLDTTIYTKQNEYFNKGRIPLNDAFRYTAKLVDGTPVRTLFDTGATKSMFNKKFYKENGLAQTYPTISIPTVRVKVGNDQTIIVKEVIKIPINLEGHMIEFIAFLLPFSADLDFVFGAKSMTELEANLDLQNLNFDFLMRSIDLKMVKEVTIPPGKTSIVTLEMVTKPRDLHDGMAIVKLHSGNENRLPVTMRRLLKNGQLQTNILNNTKLPLSFKEGALAGCIDLRSLGYFHLTAGKIQRLIGDKFVYFDEKGRKVDETGAVEQFNVLTPISKLPDEPEDEPKGDNTKLIVKPGYLPLPTRKERKDAKRKERVKNKSSSSQKEDPYPWLDKDDPRRTLTDMEILRKYVDLSESTLSQKGRDRFYRVLMRYKDAFSLRDEIGTCPNMEVKLELKDKSPFFIRPFPISETEKAIVDKEMKKGVCLGILKKKLTSYSSPIMLIPRKQGGIPRIVTDFRHLNSRLTKLNCTFPLVRDAIQMLGASKCQVISVIDLRDAYHTLRLALESQMYCGITPYYGSDTYVYQRLGMGLSVSPAIWQTFINQVLEGIEERKHHLAIMDDCLVHSKEADHEKHLKALFKALMKNGLKISPKKCQFFQKKLVYMGHQLSIEGETPCIAPLKSRIEAIQRVEPPTTIRGCRSFCGMVNFLGMFMPSLQRKLIPIYHLTRTGVPFVWTDECQAAFENIKQDLMKAPVLSMPNGKDPFCLVSDTSIEATGAALYQKQNNQWKLIGYNSKKLTGAARGYSELELFGLAINIHTFKHLLKHATFTVVIDHSALTYIMKSKKQPPTLRLQKLIEKLSAFSFRVHFMKGKDMFVSDFLSRHPGDDRYPQNEIIPISFDVSEITDDSKRLKFVQYLLERPGQLDGLMAVSYPHMTMRVTRSRGKKHGLEVKPIYPMVGEHKKPEHQEQPEDKAKDDDPIPEAEEDDKVPPIAPIEYEEEQPPLNPDTPIDPPKQPLVPIPEIENDLPEEGMGDRVPPVEEPGEVQDEEIVREPRPIDIRLIGNLENPGDFEEKEPEVHVRDPDEIMYRDPKPMIDHINDEDIIRKHLPKQVQLDKWIEKLKRKILQDYDIPITVKELIAEYEASPQFRDIYKYITKDFVPAQFKGHKLRTFKAQCEGYVVVRGVLFKITHFPEQKSEMQLLMVIPEKMIPLIFYQYHDSILAAHQGLQRTFATIKRLYYIRDLFQLLHRYIEACHTCQTRRPKMEYAKAHHARYPINYRPMSRISADLKWMPQSTQKMQYILVCTCEVTGYTVGIPIRDAKALTIAEALLGRVIFMFGPPNTLIIDQDRALSANVMLHIYKTLDITTKVVSPGNHGSLKTERSIRTISDIISKCLTGTGRNWPLYVNAACYAHNTFVITRLGFSPFELVFLQKPAALTNIHFDPIEHMPVAKNVAEFMDILKQRFEMMRKIVENKRTLEQEQQVEREKRVHPNEHVYRKGDLVYLLAPGYGALVFPSRKIRQDYIGPLQVATVLDKTHVWLCDLDGKLLPFLHTTVHIRDLKPCYLNLGYDKKRVIATVSNAKDFLHEKRFFEPP